MLPRIIRLGPGEDRVRIRARDGGLDIDVNERRVHVPPAEAQDLTIDLGPGDDDVAVIGHVRQRLRILGGSGDDRIVGGDGNDRVFGGPGDDHIDGGAGDDLVEGQGGHDTIAGGRGDDVLYGLDGDDVLDGGPGDDVLDGGGGADRLYGGAGDDVAIGGAGDDALDGGAGDDLLAGGSGQDRLRGGLGADLAVDRRGTTTIDTIEASRVHVAAAPAPGIAIRGDADFLARVRSDLATLGALPEGRALLERLAAAGGRTVIRESHALFSTARVHPAVEIQFVRAQHNLIDGLEALGSERLREPSFARLPPAIALGHELIHALHAHDGTLLEWREDEEQRTVGLLHDHDGDPSTAQRAERALTENALRRAMRIVERARYHAGDPDTRPRGPEDWID